MGRLMKELGTHGHHNTGLPVYEAADVPDYPEWKDYMDSIGPLLRPRVETVLEEIRQGKRSAWTQPDRPYIFDHHDVFTGTSFLV